MNTTTTTAPTVTNLDVVKSPNLYMGDLRHMIEREFGHPVEVIARKIEHLNCMMFYFECSEPFMEYSITIGYDDRPYSLSQQEQEFKDFLRDYNE